MQNCGCLLDCADYITGYHFVTGLCNRDELPELFSVQCGNIDASGNAVTRETTHFGKRALDSVIDVIEHAGPEFHRHRHPGCQNFCTGSEARSLFIYLNGGTVSGHIQDLADQMLGTDTHNVGDVGICQSLRYDKRP